jgi:alkylation response protein AidB-like acyl-CoA dehydrogenase
MNTFLSETDLSLKNQYEHFASEHLLSVASTLEDGQSSLKDIFQKLGQSGFFAITVPKEYGGKGGTFLQLLLLIEAIGQFQAGVGAALTTHAAVIEAINQFGTEAQKSRFLPLLARGEIIGTLAHFEEEKQILPREVESQIVSSEGQFKLAGKKKLVLNGADAGLLLILAIEKGEGGDAPALWLVDKSSTSQITVDAEGPFIGLRSAAVCGLSFKNVLLDSKDRLGEDGAIANLSAESTKQFDYIMSITKTLLAGVALGILESSLKTATDFARTGERFGQALAQSQGIQWKLADHGTEASASRLLTYRAAWSKDEAPKEFARNAAMCKSFTARAARAHSAEAIQVLGPLNVESNSSVERFYRDSKMIELIEGSNEQQKILIVKELGI